MEKNVFDAFEDKNISVWGTIVHLEGLDLPTEALGDEIRIWLRIELKMNGI